MSPGRHTHILPWVLGAQTLDDKRRRLRALRSRSIRRSARFKGTRPTKGVDKILGKVEQDTRTILNYLSLRLHQAAICITLDGYYCVRPQNAAFSKKKYPASRMPHKVVNCSHSTKHCTETTEARHCERHSGEERHRCHPARGSGGIKLKTRRQTTKRRKRERRAKQQALSILCLGVGWLVERSRCAHTRGVGTRGLVTRRGGAVDLSAEGGDATWTAC